jgi:GNAT superfamily N-acetyltransferase
MATAIFSIESIDHEVLSDPAKHVIAPGGAILFAQFDDRILAACALMPDKPVRGHFELTKMAVTAEYQGSGIGRVLLESAVSH